MRQRERLHAVDIAKAGKESREFRPVFLLRSLVREMCEQESFTFTKALDRFADSGLRELIGDTDWNARMQRELAAKQLLRDLTRRAIPVL